MVEMVQAASPLAALLPTFTEEEWLAPLRMLLLWIAAAGVALAAMAAGARRMTGFVPLRASVVGALTFVLVASALMATPQMAAREETAERGAIDLMWRYDGDRYQAFNYNTLQYLAPEAVLPLSTVSLRGGPGGMSH